MSTRLFPSLLAIFMLPNAVLASEAGAIPHAETIPWLAHTSQPAVQLPKLGLMMKVVTPEFARVPIELPHPASGTLPYLVTRPASLKGSTQ